MSKSRISGRTTTAASPAAAAQRTRRTGSNPSAAPISAHCPYEMPTSSCVAALAGS
jgi:hypothetical protein